MFSLVSAVLTSAAVYLGDRLRLKMIYIQLLSQAKKEFPYYHESSCDFDSKTIRFLTRLRKSIRQAPAIFQEDLRVLTHENSYAGLRSAAIFESLLSGFRKIDDIGRIMRTLFSLSINFGKTVS